MLVWIILFQLFNPTVGPTLASAGVLDEPEDPKNSFGYSIANEDSFRLNANLDLGRSSKNRMFDQEHSSLDLQWSINERDIYFGGVPDADLFGGLHLELSAIPWLIGRRVKNEFAENNPSQSGSQQDSRWHSMVEELSGIWGTNQDDWSGFLRMGKTHKDGGRPTDAQGRTDANWFRAFRSGIEEAGGSHSTGLVGASFVDSPRPSTVDRMRWILEGEVFHNRLDSGSGAETMAYKLGMSRDERNEDERWLKLDSFGGRIGIEDSSLKGNRLVLTFANHPNVSGKGRGDTSLFAGADGNLQDCSLTSGNLGQVVSYVHIDFYRDLGSTDDQIAMKRGLGASIEGHSYTIGESETSWMPFVAFEKMGQQFNPLVDVQKVHDQLKFVGGVTLDFSRLVMSNPLGQCLLTGEYGYAKEDRDSFRPYAAASLRFIVPIGRISQKEFKLWQ